MNTPRCRLSATCYAALIASSLLAQAPEAPLSPGEFTGLRSAASREAKVELSQRLLFRLDALERDYAQLRRAVVAADSAAFSAEVAELREASLHHSELIVRFANLRDNKDMSDGLVKIVSINSVGQDNALGFDFTETMTALVNSTITASLDSDARQGPPVTASAKGRWRGIVERLVTSPIISDLLRSNPFTSLATSVISSAMAFTSNNVNTSVSLDTDVPELPKKYRDFADHWVEFIRVDPTGVYTEDASRLAIEEAAIAEFVARITPYAELYDSMSQRNVVFETQLGDWQASFDELQARYREYTARLAAHLTVDDARIGRRLDEIRVELLRMDPRNPLRFSDALREHDALFELTSEFSALRASARELQEEFYALHRGYFRDYVGLLDTAERMAAAGEVAFDVEEIREAREYLLELAG